MCESVTEVWIGGGVHYDQTDEREGHAGHCVQGAFAEVVGGVDENEETEGSTGGNIVSLNLNRGEK